MLGIATISGFRESDLEGSGTEDTHRKILRPLADGRALVYDVRPWNASPRAFAAMMVRDGIDRLVIVGYSWGAGYGAQRLARACARFGIVVELMLLCDPVFRPLWLPAWGVANLFGFRALIPRSACIEIPANVRRVASVFQRQTVPQGHPVRACSAWTEVVPALEVESTHTLIDSSPEWQAMVTNELGETLRQ